MTLSKETIRNSKPKVKVVAVEEWGGDVLIRRMSIEAADKLQSLDISKASSQVDMLMAALVDDAGKPLFAEEDREFLADQDVKLMTRLVEEVNEFNGFSVKPADKEKNLEPGPSESSDSR